MTALQALPAGKIVRAIAGAAERWSDGDFPPRVRALDRICERTGYSAPVAEYALDRLFFSVTQAQLRATIASELGCVEILDDFTARPGRPAALAVPVGRVCIVSSRTTIGVALVPAIFALCAKCDVLVKDREDALAAAFFETLAQEFEEFSQAARARAWESAQNEASPLEDFDAVVAFGSDETLRAIARSLGERERFIGYGSRASVGYVGRESLAHESTAVHIAVGAARDALLYESEGCLSLHALFVEEGGAVEPQRFCALLAAAMERASVEFPPGTRDVSVTAQMLQQRSLAAFRSAGGTGAVFANTEAEYMLLFDPPPAEPPSFLPRTLGVMPVNGPTHALAYVRRHRLAIEGFALGEARADVVRLAIDAGAARLTAFGELQHPPLGGNHGGRPRIAQFVRWIDKSL